MSPEEYGQKTDRELWLHYVKPASDRADRMKRATQPASFEPQTKEEEDAALSMMMMMLPGNTITRAEWEARHGGSNAGEPGVGHPESG